MQALLFIAVIYSHKIFIPEAALCITPTQTTE